MEKDTINKLKNILNFTNLLLDKDNDFKISMHCDRDAPQANNDWWGHQQEHMVIHYLAENDTNPRELEVIYNKLRCTAAKRWMNEVLTSDGETEIQWDEMKQGLCHKNELKTITIIQYIIHYLSIMQNCKNDGLNERLNRNIIVNFCVGYKSGIFQPLSNIDEIIKEGFCKLAAHEETRNLYQVLYILTNEQCDLTCQNVLINEIDLLTKELIS